MFYLHSEVYIYICGCKAFKVLVSLPGIKLVPSAVRAQSLKHWTAREFPCFYVSLSLEPFSAVRRESQLLEFLPSVPGS